MSGEGESRKLGAVVGREVHRRRRGVGVSQDRLAVAMRSVGLDWTRAAVASLETGRRGLTAEELLLLPAALALVGAGPMTLADLFPEGEWVQLAPGLDARGIAIRDALTGDYHLAGGTTPIDPTLRQMVDAKGAAQPFGLAYDGHGWRQVAADADTEAARHAARRLDVSPLVVTAAAHALWGRGVTEERDTRVAERQPPDATPRHLQALRGHVTRELLSELQRSIEEATDG